MMRAGIMKRTKRGIIKQNSNQDIQIFLTFAVPKIYPGYLPSVGIQRCGRVIGGKALLIN